MTSTVVVGGAIANKAGNGGESWVRLSWAEGLRRLGLDVWLVEEIAPETCVDDEGKPASFQESANRSYFAHVARHHGWAGRAVLVCPGDEPQAWGASWADAVAVATDADALVNISGNLRHPSLVAGPRHVAYVDLDPGFTQIWQEQGADLGLDRHDLFFTLGARIGAPGCPIPTGGREWRHVHPPVVLDDWPVVPCEFPELFTTVGSWRGAYGPVEHEGRRYGVKAHEFRKLAPLPGLAPGRYEIAMSVDSGDERDRHLLADAGWSLRKPSEVAADPACFRRYVQGSGAEVSAAQGMYVQSMSGWFSDRTVRYLASGRPALVQDTGFGGELPTGVGLVPFTDLAGAVAGVARISTDWAAHSEAARAIAEVHFAHDVVLPRFLDACGIA